MLTITIEDSAFRHLLQQLQQRVGDLTEPMGDIGNALETNIRNRFATATDPNGQKWKAWAPSTQKYYPHPGSKSAQRAKEGIGHGRLLDRYGHMLGLLSYQADSTSVRIGFAHEYATHHEYGAPKRNLERRGMLMGNPQQGALGPQDEATVMDILVDWLKL